MVSSVGESSGSGLITLDEEDDIPDGPVPPTVQKYIDAGVISYRDAKAIGFLSSPENAMFVALFESGELRDETRPHNQNSERTPFGLCCAQYQPNSFKNK